MNSTIFLLSFLIPLALGLIEFKLDKKKADIVMLISALSSLALTSYGLVLFLGNRGIYHLVYIHSQGLGEVFGFVVDTMSVLMAFIVSLTALLILLYAIDYMSSSNKLHPVTSGKGTFYGWMLILEGAVLGFVFSSSLLSFLVFAEVIAIATWGVIRYYKTPNARHAANKAFGFINLSMLFGLLLVVVFGLVKYHDTSLYALTQLDSHAKLWVFLGVMFTAITMSSQFPLYSWLPDSTEAPTPASAFTHSIGIVEAGLFMMVRTIQFMDGIPKTAYYVIAILVVITQVMSIFYYPLQKDAKRLLAYSTIAQVGIMYVALLGAMLGSAGGLQASVYQLFNHSLVKSLAFLVAGTFGFSFGTFDMKKIKGLRWILPGAAVGWFLALLGLAGVPPMGLFLSKANVIMTGTMAVRGASWIEWIPVLLVLVDATIFFMVAVLWMKSMLFGEPSYEKGKISPLMYAVLIVLIVVMTVSPFLTLHLTESIRFIGG